MLLVDFKYKNQQDKEKEKRGYNQSDKIWKKNKTKQRMNEAYNIETRYTPIRRQ